jgi:hypothetical protein
MPCILFNNCFNIYIRSELKIDTKNIHLSKNSSIIIIILKNFTSIKFENHSITYIIMPYGIYIR